MRDMLFRGKEKGTNKWVEGGYFHHLNRMVSPIGDSLKDEDHTHYILTNGFSDWNMQRPIEMTEVHPETVGQYTGRMTDGKRIFEHDIIQFEHSDWATEEDTIDRGVVLFIDDAWKVSIIGMEDNEYFGVITLKSACRHSGVKIVGNRIDNPKKEVKMKGEV